MNNINFSLSYRAVSWYLAAACLALAAAWCIGYTMGHHTAQSEFVEQLAADSLKDTVYAHLCDPQVPEKIDLADELSEQKLPEQDIAELAVVVPLLSESAMPLLAQQIIPEIPQKKQSYYAQLIGFGTSQAAQQFANKLTVQKHPVFVKTRTSLTPRGKKRIWYQVVTEPFENREELEQLVAILEKAHKLRNVAIGRV